MNINLALSLCCFAWMSATVIQGQDSSASDPVVERYIIESDEANQSYIRVLEDKKRLIENRQLLSLQPLIAYLNAEISYVSGDRTKSRLILSDEGHPNVAALKAASSAMFTTLLAEQNSYEQNHRLLIERFEDEAKKLKWSEARVALGRTAVVERIKTQSQASDISSLVKSVKELKVPSSILTRKTDKIYYLTVVEGTAGLTAETALKIAYAKFPSRQVHLFGPADTGGTLKDCFRAISGNGIEHRCYINAGWNMLTGTLKLPIEGADLTYREVEKPAKSDAEYITIVAGAPDPKDPKSILVYTIRGDLKPFWVKTHTSAQDVFGILVTVSAEKPN